jgi:Tfp pilus assembly protein PilF
VDTSPEPVDRRAALIHREVVQLIQLGAIAVLAFFMTRALAASNRATALRDGAVWYERGTMFLGQGDLDSAVAAFRRASAADPGQAKYALAAADALAREHQNDAARVVLLKLRETMPASRAVNLQLARLAAAGHDVSEAVAAYRNTLYAPWPDDARAERRRIRFELVDLLLAANQPDKATVELMALAADAPDEAAVHAELATRFARAGDNHQALRHFRAALREMRHDDNVLAGAGNAALALGDYSLARQYYRGIRAPAPAIIDNRDLVELIVASDPLQPRLGGRERQRRLAADLEYARARLQACRDAAAPGSDSPDTGALAQRAALFARRLRRSLDIDTVEEGVSLMHQLIAAAAHACPPAALRDRALLAITPHQTGPGPAS